MEMDWLKYVKTAKVIIAKLANLGIISVYHALMIGNQIKFIN